MSENLVKSDKHEKTILGSIFRNAIAYGLRFLLDLKRSKSGFSSGLKMLLKKVLASYI